MKNIDHSPLISSNLIKKDISLFSKECKFVLGVVNAKQLPCTDYPEFAFWGRSNVGKSSLINSLVNRKKLVKVSNTPGRTREINYFSLIDMLYLVDLPGYGYAKVSKSVKDKWNYLVVDYLKYSSNLRRIYLLIDSRVGFKEIDFEIMDFLDYYGRSYQIILTKIDKINKLEFKDLSSKINEITSYRPACYPDFLSTSSAKNIGIHDIRISILNLL